MKHYFCVFLFLSLTVSCQTVAIKKDVNCPYGFIGEKCDKAVCNPTDPDDLSPNGKSLTFMVHDSTTTIQMIQKMQSEMARVIYDMVEQYPNWMTTFNLIRFDDFSISQPIETTDPNVFLNGFKQFAAETAINTTKRSCKDIPALESVYVFLGSFSSLTPPNSEIYIFMNGIMRYYSPLFNSVQDLLIQTKTKVNFVQDSAFPCGESVTSEGPSLMWNISSISGGEVYVISSNSVINLMKTLPFGYETSKISEAFFEDCSKEQVYKFPVDSQTQTVNLLIEGELNGNPKYTDSNGDSNAVYTAYSDYAANTRFDQIVGACNSEDGYWSYANGKCWSFNTELKTWKEAQKYCSDRNSVLMSILSDDDQQFINQKIGTASIWIGLNDLENEGKFVWDQNQNSSLPLSYTYWGKDEPNLENGRCATSNIYEKWQVQNCDEKRLAVCARNFYNSIIDKFTPYSVTPGYWAIKLKTYAGACSVKITTQSNIFVYSSFVKNKYDDIGTVSPISEINNYVILHVDGLKSSNGTKNGSLQSVTFSSADTSFTLKMHLRDLQTCKHEYISSESFQCLPGNYHMALNGVDSNGYDFQRRQIVVCSDATTEKL